METLRIGTVQSVDITQRTVRAFFTDTKIVSAPLKVLRHCADLSDAWLPNVNDTVLCLYKESFNGDGYVIGGV